MSGVNQSFRSTGSLGTICSILALAALSAGVPFIIWFTIAWVSWQYGEETPEGISLLSIQIASRGMLMLLGGLAAAMTVRRRRTTEPWRVGRIGIPIGVGLSVALMAWISLGAMYWKIPLFPSAIGVVVALIVGFSATWLAVSLGTRAR